MVNIYEKIILPDFIKFPISSPFGTERPDLVSSLGLKSFFHKGVDFAAPMSTPILSFLDGLIFMCGWEEPSNPKYGFGQRIWVLTKHKCFGNIRIGYCHLSSINVSHGQTIRQGEKIGESGSSGASTGPHIHIQVEKWPSREILEPVFEKEDK